MADLGGIIWTGVSRSFVEFNQVELRLLLTEF